MPEAKLSPEEHAVRSGYWRVSLPVWLVMMGFFFSPILVLGIEKAFDEDLWIECVFIVLGIIASWAWWSVAAPRWRLWAYQRVEDLELLERLAVADKLVWPSTHPFTRTEFRWGKLGEHLRNFEARMAEQRL